MRELENKGLSQKDIAKMFYGPSAVSHWLYSANFAFEGMSREEVIDFIKRTIDIIEYWRKEDPFCLNWRNIIWKTNKVRDEYGKEGFIDSTGDITIAKILGHINMIAWHYCILIHVGHRNYSHEFHGPYYIGDNEILFVREYFNLRPYEIWPFASLQNVPFSKITSLEVYKNVEIKIDAFNHIWASAALARYLQRFLIVLDDSKVLTENGVKDLLSKWTNIITQAIAFIRNYTKEDFVRKVIEMKYWLLKPHKEILREEWRAPRNILDLAKNYKEAEVIARKAIQGQIERIKGHSEKEAIEKMTQMYLDNVYEGKMYF